MKNIKCALYIGLLLSAISTKVAAQSFEPIFEDADGKTSIIAPRGFFGVNTANSSIRFQYFYSKSASPDPDNPRQIGKWNRFYCGVNITGAADGGVSNLFSDGAFNPGTSADFLIGHRSLFFGTLDRKDKSGETVRFYGNRKTTIQDWLTLRGGVKAASYKLYNSSRPFNEQLTTEVFRGRIAQLAYTLLFNGATSVGASFDVSRVNNIDNLTPVKYRQQTVVTDPTGSTTRTFEREVSAYSGNYQTSLVNTYSMDLVHLLTSETSPTKFAFHAFGRMLTNDVSVYKAGLGFYAFPKGKLFGGVFVQSNDLTNKVSETSNFLKRVEIGLTVKFVLSTLGEIGK